MHKFDPTTTSNRSAFAIDNQDPKFLRNTIVMDMEADMLGLPGSLRHTVACRFSQARSTRALVFSDTQLALLQGPDIPTVQLRYCPALSKKPSKDNDSDKQSKGKFDPFDDPASDLLVAAVPASNPTHNIVLNKYPVIVNHIILATKENKPQTNLLEAEDLRLTYACLQAWKEHAHSLFAFFNSGEHSGASQPHRHLQFLPVEDMNASEGSTWEPLCQTMKSPAHGSMPLLRNASLPFIHFATRLDKGMTESELLANYFMLMKAAVATMHGTASLDNLDSVTISEQGKTTFSYNLAMTTDIMAILPRRSESFTIPGMSNSSVAINGTILAGTMMVKAEKEWTCFQQRPDLVLQVFDNIAYPREKVP